MSYDEPDYSAFAGEPHFKCAKCQRVTPCSTAHHAMDGKVICGLCHAEANTAALGKVARAEMETVIDQKAEINRLTEELRQARNLDLRMVVGFEAGKEDAEARIKVEIAEWRDLARRLTNALWERAFNGVALPNLDKLIDEARARLGESEG